MRLWSIHPKYLDPVGLVALWRESLLARQVLLGHTQGYRQHPQLIRFRESAFPISAINAYLWSIFAEASSRGYHFDPDKADRVTLDSLIPVTTGQLQYEYAHLLNKLRNRNTDRFRLLKKVDKIEPNPCFVVVKGTIANWEKLQK